MSPKDQRKATRLICLVVAWASAIAHADAKDPLGVAWALMSQGKSGEAYHYLEANPLEGPEYEYTIAQAAMQSTAPVVDGRVIEEHARRAVALAPDTAAYQVLLAQAILGQVAAHPTIFQRGRVFEALDHLTRAISADPRAALEAYQVQAEFYTVAPWWLGGSRAKAEEAIGNIERIDADLGLMAWLVYFTHVRDDVGVRRTYQAAIRRSPDEFGLYSGYIGYLLRTPRDYAVALELFPQAIALAAPTQAASMLMQWAEALGKAGDAAGAVAKAREALKCDEETATPEHRAWMLATYGDLLARVGLTAEARRAYSRSLEALPDPDVERRLSSLPAGGEQ